jgi:hypothetical protein
MIGLPAETDEDVNGPTERIVVPADGLLYGEDHVVTVVPPGDE